MTEQQKATTADELLDFAKAIERVFTLGQNYWADADSESYARNRNSVVTLEKFRALKAGMLERLHATPQPADARASAVAESQAWYDDEARDVLDRFYWRVSPAADGKHRVEDTAVKAVIRLCERLIEASNAGKDAAPPPIARSDADDDLRSLAAQRTHERDEERARVDRILGFVDVALCAVDSLPQSEERDDAQKKLRAMFDAGKYTTRADAAPVAKEVHRSQRRVVCAACKLEDGTMVIGVRHMDGIMISNASRIGKKFMHAIDAQGFIDQWGVFMTRREAWDVAKAADQIRYRCGGDTTYSGTLYSENLY